MKRKGSIGEFSAVAFGGAAALTVIAVAVIGGNLLTVGVSIFLFLLFAVAIGIGISVNS